MTTFSKKGLYETRVKEIREFLDKADWNTVFEKCNDLPWSREGLFLLNSLRNDIIARVQGFDASTRTRLNLLLDMEFMSSQKTFLANDALCKDLLKEDFIQQKAIAREKCTAKTNFIVMQGTPSCGLHYYILHKHPDWDLIPIKSQAPAFADTDTSDFFWQAIGQSFRITPYPRMDIRTLIAMSVNEKSKAVVIFGIEQWGDKCSEKLKTIVNYLDEIPVVDNYLNFYFLHTGLQGDGIFPLEEPIHERLTIFPPITCIDENQVFNILDNNRSHFKSTDIDTVLCGKKRLSEVIDIFIDHCHDDIAHEIQNHLNKLPLI
jgi:hypothetical protein